jgi:hypothetical protein
MKQGTYIVRADGRKATSDRYVHVRENGTGRVTYSTNDIINEFTSEELAERYAMWQNMGLTIEKL